jgi:(p)ppGpp synthase/HD superfamily hydrolase
MRLPSIVISLQEDLMMIVKDYNIKLLKLEWRIKKVGLAKRRAETERIPHDIYGFRLILEKEEACHTIGMTIRKLNTVRRYRDYISNPWNDGYQSIHIDLLIEKYPIEIQLRTKLMDTLSKRLIEEKGQKYWKETGFRKHISL